MQINIKTLIKKIKNKKYNVGVIGLGYVGLPLVNRFLKSKHLKVFGIDKIKKIKLLKKGYHH